MSSGCPLMNISRYAPSSINITFFFPRVAAVGESKPVLLPSVELLRLSEPPRALALTAGIEAENNFFFSGSLSRSSGLYSGPLAQRTQNVSKLASGWQNQGHSMVARRGPFRRRAKALGCMCVCVFVRVLAVSASERATLHVYREKVENGSNPG